MPENHNREAKIEKERRKKGGNVKKDEMVALVFILTSSFLNDKKNCLTEEIYSAVTFAKMLPVIQKCSSNNVGNRRWQRFAAQSRNRP